MLKRLCENIWYLPHMEATDRPALGYVKGERLSLMIDAGNSARHVELFFEELKKNGLAPPDLCAITHSHWDHTYAMPYVGVPCIANRLTNEIIANMQTWEWTDAAMKARLASGEDIEFCDSMIRAEYPKLDEIRLSRAEIEYERSLVLDLGGLTARISLVGGSHAPDCAVIFIEQERVLFTGDCDSYDFHHGEVYYPDKNRELVARLNAIDFQTAVMSHYVPQTREDFLAMLPTL